MDRESMIEMFSGIVGQDGVRSDREAVVAYFDTPPNNDDLIAVLPRSHDEVSRIAALAGEQGIALNTLSDRTLSPAAVPRSGAILDFSGMDAIERLDDKNLMVHLQRGVTYEALGEALEGTGTKAMYPAATTTPSMACNAVNNAIFRCAVRYPELQFSNLYVILADGRLHKTGSHALSEEISDWRDEAGPHISKWYNAAGDIYGIVTRASALLFPRLEARAVRAYGFDQAGAAAAAMKEISRKEICQECLALDRGYLAHVLGQVLSAPAPAPWILIVGHESFKAHVEFQQRTVDGIVGEHGGKPLGALQEEIAAAMEVPWYVPDGCHLSYYTLFAHLETFDSALEEGLKRLGMDLESASRILVSYGSGRTLYCGWSLGEGREGAAECFDDLRTALVEKGAFFERPLGAAAKAVYERSGGYLDQMKRIKAMVDPHHILNPGQPVDMR